MNTHPNSPPTNKKTVLQKVTDVAESDTPVMDDEALLQQYFRTNPRQGCELLFRRYYTNLCNHAIRFVYSKEVAEDIVAEVFTNFWQTQAYETITTSYRGYLYKAVRYRAYTYLKWEVNRTSSSESSDLNHVPTFLTPDEILHFNELYQKVEAVIQQLPPQCRRAFLLSRLEGRKYHEIADELQIGSKAVERLISRALARLKAELKDEWLLLLLIFPYLTHSLPC